MIAQKRSNEELFEMLSSWASCWEPTSRQFFNMPVGVQPHQKGFQVKLIKLILWLAEEYGAPSDEVAPKTVEWWVSTRKIPSGWQSWLFLLSKVLPSQSKIAA